MKKFACVGLVFFLLAVTADANARFGKRFYMKKLYRTCEKDGVADGGKFAKKHSQMEWDELKESGKLLLEWKKICPSGSTVFDTMRRKDIKNLHDFVWKYATDGELPTCN